MTGLITPSTFVHKFLKVILRSIRSYHPDQTLQEVDPATTYQMNLDDSEADQDGYNTRF